MIQAHSNESQDLLALADFSFVHTTISAFWITSSGALYRVNQAACNFLGYSATQLESLQVFDIDPSASKETWSNHWHKLRTQKKLTFTSRHLTKTGQLKPVEITINYLKIGSQEFNVAFAKDLTERHDMENALRDTQERYSLVIEAVNDGIWDWDIQAQRISFSERWYSMLGISAEQKCQTAEDWLVKVHPGDRPRLETTLHEYCTGKIDRLKTEFRILHTQGHYLWMYCQGKGLHDFNDKIYRIAGSMTDITEYRQAQTQRIYDALHDPLTGLPNRNFLLDHIEQLNLELDETPTTNFAVLFLDLDRFKLVNESLGHRAGDQLLIEVGNRLRQCIHPKHTVARLGGDEFIVLLRHIATPNDAIDITKKILNTLNIPVYLDDQIIYPSVSIGIALSNPNAIMGSCTPKVSAEEYLKKADIAMYQAKASKHAQYSLFTAEMQSKVMTRLQLEVELQSALERGELELVYQPIIDLKHHELLGFESLMRWQHPIKGCISPTVFVPIAEETGLIFPLGTWALKTACRQMAQWQLLESCNPNLFVTINLASSQLMQPDFVCLMDQILDETGVNPKNIKLEITESAVIENKDFARQQILALRDRHIRICMDDFGTGYSSLGYLHQLPIDCLKIDQSFVQQIQCKQDNPEIIRAILAIAHSLSMNIIAEGIETHQQSILLQEMGCPCGQGYFFDRPLSSIEAFKRITESGQNIKISSLLNDHLDLSLVS